MNKKNIILLVLIIILMFVGIGIFIYNIDNDDNISGVNNDSGLLDGDNIINSDEDDVLTDSGINDFDNELENDNNDIIKDNDNNEDYTDDEIVQEDKDGIKDNNTGIFDSKEDDDINNKREIKYINKFPHDGYCAQGIDEFYKKNGVTYYFTCQISQYIYVVVNGVEYGLVEALENNIVTIEEVELAKGSKFLSKSNNTYSY